MPAGKDPSGKTWVTCEVIATDVKIDPPLPNKGTLLAELVVEDMPATLSEPSTGNCKTFISLYPKVTDGFSISAFEPGCDTQALHARKEHAFEKGLVGTAKATLKSGGTIQLAFAIQPDAGGKPVGASTKKLEVNDWKDAPSHSMLNARWSIDQSKATPPIAGGTADDLTKHKVPVELTLTLNGHSHTVSLETNAAPPYSDKCGHVSFFWADTNIGFELARAQGGRAVLTRTDMFGTTKTEQLYVFDLPAQTRLTQEIVTIAPDGKSATKRCSAIGLP